ncbi:MAG: HEPN domain-containing protein [Anaerolineae bacterium]|nr:HEPN domain-containing protein [Anaerolineae bacterium]
MTSSTEIKLYLDRAYQELKAADSNLHLAYYNVAVSRAYYAMFYAATALLLSKDVSRSKHSGVLSAFGEYFVKTGSIEVEYAKMLGHAFDSRLDTDYDMTFSANLALSEQILCDAQRFVKRIEIYLYHAGVL